MPMRDLLVIAKFLVLCNIINIFASFTSKFLFLFCDFRHLLCNSFNVLHSQVAEMGSVFNFSDMLAGF